MTILSEPFLKEEIEEAVFQMHHTKAMGLDGFLSLFYEKYWNIIGDEVSHFCLQVLHGNASPSTINKTLLVLIHKIKEPMHPTHFKPISLCNVMANVEWRSTTSSYENERQESV